MFDPTKPYNDLPLLPPSSELETTAVLRKVTTARVALERLRSAHIPDQAVLSTIPLLEAKGSSEIENIVTTHDALFREAGREDDESEPATKEALRYRKALYQGFESLRDRPITTRLAVDICRTIKEIELDIRATPGTTLTNKETGDVIYTPPMGQERIRDLLSNWERFLNESNSLDPLIRMAVQHYQFEAIHPFNDGNGRTGRILNILCLVQDKLLDRPTLYLSRHILATRPEYYARLAHVTSRGEWVPWILYMLEAVEQTSRWTAQKVGAIQSLMEIADQHVRKHAPGIYSRELIELIFAQPYCRISNVVDKGIAKRQSASRYLKSLRQIGILDELKYGRDKVFVHFRYSDLLQDEHNEFEPYETRELAESISPKK